jgi:hypothetical protein
MVRALCTRSQNPPNAHASVRYTCGGNIQYNKRRELNKGYQLITSLCALPGGAQQTRHRMRAADDAIQIQFCAVGLSSIRICVYVYIQHKHQGLCVRTRYITNIAL